MARSKNSSASAGSSSSGGSSSDSPSTSKATSTMRYSLRKRDSATAQQGPSGKSPSGVAYDSDAELEMLLNQHEEDGIREREEKRMKTSFNWYSETCEAQGPPPEPIPLDHLPSPCIELIFEMLDSPRDVYNLAFTSNFVLSHVNSEIVIRSAVHENCEKQKQPSHRIITHIIDMVRARSIRIPSALRLLRLLNAQRCERGELCWGYDLEKSRSHPRLEGNSRRPFGLAICNQCIKGSMVSVPRWYNSFANGEDRVASHNWNHVFQPNAAAELDGDIGPIIHARHIFQITNTHSGSQEQKKEALQRLIVELYGEEGSEERTLYESRADELVEIYDRAVTDLEEYLDAKAKKQSDEISRKHNERLAKRIEKTRPILDKLRLLLDGEPQMELALEHTWDEQNYYSILSFEHRFVAQATKRIVDAPASATQKAIVSAADRIKENLQTLKESQEFFSFSFLEGAASTLKQVLRTYCIQQYPSMTDLLKEREANGRFFELLQKKMYMTALICVLRSSPDHIPAVVTRTFVSDGHPNVAKYRSLAKTCWEKFRQSRLPMGNGIISEWTPTDFRTVISACKAEYRRMKQNARDYLARPDVVAYLGANILGEPFSRQDAIDQVFSPKRTSVRGWGMHWGIPQNIQNEVPYNLLLNRQFQLLLQVHQYYYRKGSA